MKRISMIVSDGDADDVCARFSTRATEFAMARVADKPRGKTAADVALDYIGDGKPVRTDVYEHLRSSGYTSGTAVQTVSLLVRAKQLETDGHRIRRVKS